MNATYRSFSVTSAPAELALPIQEVSEHLRLGDLLDENYLLLLIKAVTTSVERHLGRALITQTIRDVHDKFPPTKEPILLRMGPVQSVTSVQYRASDGTLTTVDSAYYVTDLGGSAGDRIGIAENYSWPTPQNRIGAVQITYVAGYGATYASIPEDIKIAMKLILYDLYENRADTTRKYPTAAEMILMPYRQQHLS